MSQTGADAMLEEVARLPEDLPMLVERACRPDPALREPLAGTDRVVLTGCGDSLCAAQAMAPAMRLIARMPVSVTGPRRLVAGDGGEPEPAGETLVVGISASGGTPAVAEALKAAKSAGRRTLLITGRTGGAIGTWADATLLLPLPDKKPAPGVRTYQASLVGLLACALHLALAAGRAELGAHERWTALLAACAGPLRIAIDGAARHADQLVRDLAAAPLMLILGTGTGLATARYAAAKRIEASGLYAAAQDMEEAFHVDRFASPRDLPVLVIAPPGETADEAAEAALVARGLGRRVYTLCATGERAVRRHATLALDHPPAPLACLAPLIGHAPLAHVFGLEARTLGHAPFRSDRPEIRAGLEAYRRAQEGAGEPPVAAS